ncbi:MAG: minor capsid protein [Lachnospiraceae bacterium]|nr:minor capsid protein [Lachnospiraceae bacterium]
MAKVRLQLDSAQKIITKRGLQKAGHIQRLLTHEVRRRCDPYVPFLSGTMKNTAIESTDSITYPQVYSEKQYFKNKGNGLRGKEWDVRMMADQGDDLVATIARAAGGKKG